jgi:hypothetical protein
MVEIAGAFKRYGSTGFNLYSPHLGTDGRVGEVEARDVAVQVAFESKGLKPDFHFIGSRVETGRYQAMGHTGFNLYTAPP